MSAARKPLLDRLRALRDAVYARPGLVLALLGVASVLVYLAAIPLPRVDGQLVGSDGVRYYMYVRSFWIDGDLDFHNEYQVFYGKTGPLIERTGLVHNQYSIGCGLLWTPFFLLAHLIAAALNAVGVAVPMDGYSYLYQGLTLLGSVVYGFLGMVLGYRTARRLYESRSALLGTVSVWLASNVLYYMIAEPSMAHANAMFVVAAFVALWQRTLPDRTLLQWVALGLIGALMLMVRLVDGAYLLIPALEALVTLIRHVAARDFRSAGRQLGRNVAFLAALLVGYVPQFVTWRVMYGTFTIGRFYGKGERIGESHWLAPRIPQVLFSSWHGLFTWHPVLLLAVIGLVVFLSRKHKLVALCLTATFAFNTYLISAWALWWQAAAFGGRKFMDGAVLFVVGLTALIAELKARRDTLWIEAVALALIAWNALFMIQYRFGFIPMEEPLTFRELVWDKFLLPWRLVQWLLR